VQLRAGVTLALALAAQAVGAAPKVIAVDVNGMVHPITAEIVGGALAQAKAENASLVLVRLNTPGGLMDAMRATIEKILASPVPVVTYVAPSGGRAASAGFFLLEAGDVAAMAPGTATGAAHPVLMGAEMDAVMKQKVENDAAAYLRSICGKRGRNSALAETAVLESKSFTEREALDRKLVELIAPGERQLLAELDGRAVTRFDGTVTTLHVAGAEIVEYQLTLREKIVSAIADPNIALVLLVIGASAIVDRRDVIPAAIEQVGGVIEHFGMPVDPGNLLLMARFGNAMALLIHGGIPIAQSLEIMETMMDSAPYSEILRSVTEDVRQGQLLSESLARYPKYFPTLVYQMIGIGETTGKTGQDQGD